MRLNMNDLAERWDLNLSTVRKMRQTGRLPAPMNPHVRNRFVWDSEVIDLWEASGFVSEDAAVRAERCKVLAGDLENLSKHPAIDPALAKLAGTFAAALRMDEIPVGTRVGLAAVTFSTNWFARLRTDGPEELRIMRANLRVLGMMKNAKAN